jgi:membrane protease YdiL (CAAX protease family)
MELNEPISTTAVNKHEAWKFTDILAMGGIGFLLLVAGGALLFALFGFEGGEDDLLKPTLVQTFALITLEIVGFGGAVGLVGLIRRMIWSKAAYLRSMASGWWLSSFFIGLVCIPVVNYVAFLTQQLLGQELEANPQLDIVVPEGFSWLGLVGMAILIGLLVPFVEELFFRGVLFTWLRQHWSFLPAALLTSLLFGLMHGEPFLIAGTAVLGFVSAWVMEKSGSLWAAVMIHALNNSVNVVLAYLLFA